MFSERYVEKWHIKYAKRCVIGNDQVWTAFLHMFHAFDVWLNEGVKRLKQFEQDVIEPRSAMEVMVGPTYR